MGGTVERGKFQDSVKDLSFCEYPVDDQEVIVVCGRELRELGSEGC